MNGEEEEGDEEDLAFFLGGGLEEIVLIVDAGVEAMPVSYVSGCGGPVGWV